MNMTERHPWCHKALANFDFDDASLLFAYRDKFKQTIL